MSENKIVASNISNLIASKMYYDEFGEIKEGKIDSITYTSTGNIKNSSFKVLLKDGQSFTVTVEVIK